MTEIPARFDSLIRWMLNNVDQLADAIIQIHVINIGSGLFMKCNLVEF